MLLVTPDPTKHATLKRLAIRNPTNAVEHDRRQTGQIAILNDVVCCIGTASTGRGIMTATGAHLRVEGHSSSHDPITIEAGCEVKRLVNR